MLARLPASPSSSTSARRRCRRSSPRAIAASTSSCSTSGISTSSTTSCSSGRPSASAPSCGRRGDGWLIDGFGPDGVSARVIDVTNRVVKLQTGYLYHYAFAMLIGVAALVTWMMFGSASDDRLADPLDGHLPAAGRRAADPVHPRRGRQRAPQHPQHRAVDDGRHLRRVAVHLDRLRQCRSGLPDGREDRLAGFAASPTIWASTASRCCSSS